MTLIKPFRALRPVPARAREVLAPPYDVLSSAEARQRARGKPWSFLHVSKAEIDLPEGTDPYSDAVYAKAAENLKRMIAERVLDARRPPALLRLPLGMAGPTADRHRLRRRHRRLRRQPHPQARAHPPGQGDDRVRQIEALNAQTGPVLLAYPQRRRSTRCCARATARDAGRRRDGRRRRAATPLWVIADAGRSTR